MKALDRFLQRWRISKVAPWVGSARRVLDIGCADGALERQLGPFREYVGIDELVPVADPRRRTSFLTGVFPDVEPSTGPFDVITALAILEHVPREAQARFAEACFRHLAPGGHLVLTVPSPWVDPMLDVLQRLCLLDGMETGQHYGFEPEHTPPMFVAAGFRPELTARFQLGLNYLFVFRR